MGSQVSDETLSNAILQSVQNGGYPDDEQVISAELPSSALDHLSRLLKDAREEVKASIRELSRLSAPDIDGWISQAKELKADIDESQEHAARIVALAEEGKHLQYQAYDAASKVDLLKTEVAFNGTLSGTLERIQELKRIVHDAHEAVLKNQMPTAVMILRKAEEQLENLGSFENTTLAGLIRARITDLHHTLSLTLYKCWEALIQVDTTESRVTICQEFERITPSGTARVDLDSVVAALSNLDLIKGKIIEFWKAFDTAIILPRLAQAPDRKVGILVVDQGSMHISGRTGDTSTAKLLSDINATTNYVRQNLPVTVATPLAQIMMPSLISRLISGPLASSVPPDLDGIGSYKATLDQVSTFADSLSANGWYGKEELLNWVNNAPKVWFKRREETSLHSVRQLLRRGLGNSRAVERVETQTVSREDDMFPANAKGEDWNAGWSDEGEQGLNAAQKNNAIPPMNDAPETEEREEDINAWGLDEDDATQDAAENGTTTVVQEEDDTEAWGWDDDTETTNSPTAPKQLPSAGTCHAKTNGRGTKNAPNQREVTLRESYYITAIPEQILEIIIQVVEDAETLLRSTHENPVAAAAEGLFSLPATLLFMYRAVAPNFYADDINSNMLLYNDSFYMSEQLSLFMQHHQKRTQSQGLIQNLSLDADIAALEIFGKRAYGKEMESQRTILSDLLDGSQGFINCTEHPYAQQCDLAVSSTIDHVRNVNQQWKAVLSPSALLQATGSLLSTITNKMIVDIEDMSDISEPESQRLTSFCNRIASLGDLFLPERDSSADEVQEPIPLTAVYTPSWLKFQYLTNILESSLMDIKYLWTEGQLSLEFSSDEVVDLIRALFAESEHRRKAIGEIKRASRLR